MYLLPHHYTKFPVFLSFGRKKRMYPWRAGQLIAKAESSLLDDQQPQQPSVCFMHMTDGWIRNIWKLYYLPQKSVEDLTTFSVMKILL
jgi:hypothetical protein